MSESYLSLLKRDALFKGVLEAMQEELNLRFIEKRTEVMDVLEDVSMDAAMLTRNAIHGLIDGKEVPISLRLKSAWDNLDRTGRKAVEKRLVGYVNVGDLVADAYRKKHKIEGDIAPDDFEFLADIKADREGFDE